MSVIYIDYLARTQRISATLSFFAANNVKVKKVILIEFEKSRVLDEYMDIRRNFYGIQVFMDNHYGRNNDKPQRLSKLAKESLGNYVGFTKNNSVDFDDLNKIADNSKVYYLVNDHCILNCITDIVCEDDVILVAMDELDIANYMTDVPTDRLFCYGYDAKSTGRYYEIHPDFTKKPIEQFENLFDLYEFYI